MNDTETRERVTVTVYHNISRGASFGFNSVFGTCDASNIWKIDADRTKIDFLPDGRVAWRGTARHDDQRHPMVRVFVYETGIVSSPEGVRALLENLFAQFNNGSGRENETYFGRRLRSLSVGDVLVINDEIAFACESEGWREVSAASMHVLPHGDAVQEVRKRYGFGPMERLSITVPLP